MAITDKTAVENYLLTEIDATFDAQVTEWIAGVEDEMNKMTDRQLVADASAAAYKFDGSGKDYMIIDDFLTITKVEIDSTDITTAVFTYPANSTPKWKIASDDYVFSKGRQNITITGRKGAFDSASIPEDLKYAATVLVAGIINVGNQAVGEVKSESIGRYTVQYTTSEQKQDFSRAMDVIKSYRRYR